MVMMLKSFAVSSTKSCWSPTNCSHQITELPFIFVEAKINGKRLLNNISALNSKYKLELSVGFLEEIEERAGQVRMQ